MKKIVPFALSIGICFLILMSLMWISTWKTLTLSKVEFSTQHKKHRTVTLPFSRNFIGSYTLTATIDNISGNSQEFRIIPDDEIVAIRVNGQDISLEHIPLSDRRNYGSGFLMMFDNLKANQANIFEFDIVNESNPTGFRLEATQRLSKTQFAGILISLGLFVFFLNRYFKISRLQMLCVFVGLIVSLMYLSKTDSRTRTFDVYEGGGHRDYIEHLINTHSLPNPGEGWEYHQPPLYYLIAAAAKVAGQVPNTATDLWGQLLALYFWIIFLLSGLGSFAIAFRKRKLPLIIASCALCLWPAGIIHSIRIGNDLALYAFYGLSFFYTLKWWKSRSSVYLFWASLWMGASLLTKSNGLAMTATLGLLFLFHIFYTYKDKMHFHNKKNKLIRDFAILSCTFFTAFLLNFGDNIYYFVTGSSSDWLLSNVSESINPGLKVNNEPENYLVFDSATFLLHPFISTWNDISGRQYFWNFVWRSSLSSEFSFEGDTFKHWGIVNGILLLMMLAGIAVYFLQKQPVTNLVTINRAMHKNMPWILSLVFSFILLLAYRIKVPLSCNTDFRYIYPVLISIIFFACLSWKEPKKLPIPALFTLSLVAIAVNTISWINAL